MTKNKLKIYVFLFMLMILLCYCGKESPTTSQAKAVLSLDIKESPIVSTWNPDIEKWDVAFTIVFKESGGIRAEISSIRSEALESGDIRDSFQKSYYGELRVPANETVEYEWDFSVIGEDEFDTIRLFIFVEDANGNNMSLEENFTDLSFVK